MSKNNIKLLYIDLFCGAGGTTTERKKYIGNAVETHQAAALCQSLAMAI